MSVAGTLIKISTAQVPDGFCISNLQADWPFLVGLMTGQVIGTTVQQAGAASFTVLGLNIGRNAPAAEDQSNPWVRLDSNGNPDRLYWFNNGLWLSRHQQPPGIVAMWDGIGAIDTFDGGEVGVVTPTSGPFWEIYTAMAARMPLGVGTLPAGDVIAVGTTGGEDEHTLTIPELPAHKHVYGALDANAETAGQAGQEFIRPPGTGEQIDSSETGDNEPHNNMPPYSGIYFIRRTARLFYRV